MLNISILPEELKDFNYYVKKLPMFLQQSHGFIEHFRIWHDMLIGNQHSGIVGVADTLFCMLNLFGMNDDYTFNTESYLNYINSLENSENGTKSDILDKIGQLFAVSREFDITYTYLNDEYKKHIVLNNAEFLILIKIQIVKNYCDGTYEQIIKLYESVGLRCYLKTASSPATVDMYLIDFDDNASYKPTENIKDMFLAGMLTIRNIGIIYNYLIADLTRLLIWDSNNEQYGWDGGQWAI